MSRQHLSTYLLRHKPEQLELTMDRHGWVSVEELIQKMQSAGYRDFTREQLNEIVRKDNKGRFRIQEAEDRIKACQGHTIPWVIPELTYGQPPQVLYHGTTSEACAMIQASGHISRQKRHAVHMQADVSKAWQSARRWKKIPVVLVIDARSMVRDGFLFGVSDNQVWCTESVPTGYILNILQDTADTD